MNEVIWENSRLSAELDPSDGEVYVIGFGQAYLANDLDAAIIRAMAKEIASLKQVSLLTEAFMNQITEMVRKEIVTKNATIEQLERDRERLDFVERWQYETWQDQRSAAWLVARSSEDRIFRGKTLRAAIDEAMEAGELDDDDEEPESYLDMNRRYGKALLKLDGEG